MKVSQTSFLFAALAFAFFFFVTTRGDLPKWLGLLGLAGSAGAPTGTAPGTGVTPVAGLPSLPAIPAIGQGIMGGSP